MKRIFGNVVRRSFMSSAPHPGRVNVPSFFRRDYSMRMTERSKHFSFHRAGNVVPGSCSRFSTDTTSTKTKTNNNREIDDEFDCSAIRNVEFSRTNAVLPFSSDVELRGSYESIYGDIRIAKVLEDLDLMAGAAAYAHIGGIDSANGQRLALVTASVDSIDMNDSRARPSLDEDIRYTAAVEAVGKSSMSVGVYVQKRRGDDSVRSSSSSSSSSAQSTSSSGNEDDDNGNWQDVLSSRFTMVARDASTDQPEAVNPLVPEGDDEVQINERAKVLMAEQKERSTEARAAMERPPSSDDLALVHKLVTSSKQQSIEGDIARCRPYESNLVPMSATQLESTMIMHPQFRNVHGKVFGGFLIRQAFEQAYTTAYSFARGEVNFVRVDDTRFIAPVDIGSIVRFTSRVDFADHTEEPPMSTNDVHSVSPASNHILRSPQSDDLSSPSFPFVISVCADVITPQTGETARTNTFFFTFTSKRPMTAVPHTYDEALAFVTARRYLK